MKKNRSTVQVLGIMATGRALHAVLLQNGPDGPEVMRRFTRQRLGAQPGGGMAVPEGPAENFSQTQDFSIQFGSGGATGGATTSLFLTSEFAGLDVKEGEEEEHAAANVQTFEMELTDLLAECRDAGFADPAIAFTMNAADAAFVELRMPEKQKAKRSEREQLLEMLAEQHKGSFEEERVAFMPMVPVEEGLRRFLAIFPRASDPTTATLRLMRDRKERLPAVQLLDAEVLTYVGLARVAMRDQPFEDDFGMPAMLDDPALAPAPGGAPEEPAAIAAPAANTLVVRAGLEDTLVLFMQGDTLRHYESLRSLTAFDAPETVCSRVLLQQDEHGVGDVSHVLILSEERERDLVETFEMFFPDARVSSLRSYLPKSVDDVMNSPTATVAATGAALRLLEDPLYLPAFEEVNFLPRKLLKRSRQVLIDWQAVALGVLMAITLIFFMISYTRAEREISSYQERLQRYEPDVVAQDIQQLQASIDSMQQMYASYEHALRVLDSLLIGSDRWSRALEKTSQATANVKGLWIESFQPQENGLVFIGNATSRERIVAFAERTGSIIETLTFSEIREWPVYSFTLEMPLRDDLPEAAKYLRAQVQIGTASATPPAGPNGE